MREMAMGAPHQLTTRPPARQRISHEVVGRLADAADARRLLLLFFFLWFCRFWSRRLSCLGGWFGYFFGCRFCCGSRTRSGRLGSFGSCRCSRHGLGPWLGLGHDRAWWRRRCQPQHFSPMPFEACPPIIAASIMTHIPRFPFSCRLSIQETALYSSSVLRDPA